METIGQRIKARRLDLGMSQKALADAVGVDQSIISDIERGAGFRVDVLTGLVEALRVSYEHIMRGPEPGAADLLGAWQAMDEAGRASLLAVAQSLASTHRRTDPSRKRAAGGRT